VFPSDRLKRKEFTCRCGCGSDTVDAELLVVLNTLREDFAAPVNIVSGTRCEQHNKNVGGSPKSQHLKSKAADIKVTGVPLKDVYEYLTRMYPDRYGIGLYDSFIHVDVRQNKTRW
jgi:uncharacterized protein YcbK (DUF882 family)